MPSLFYLLSEKSLPPSDMAVSAVSVEVLPTAADLASVMEAYASDPEVLEYSAISREDALQSWRFLGGMSAQDAAAHLAEQEARAGA